MPRLWSSWVLAVVIVFAPCSAAALTLKALVDGYRKQDPFVYYEACKTEIGKAMVVKGNSPGNIWFYEFYDDGQYYNSARVELRAGGVVALAEASGFGGIFSRERMRLLAEIILQMPLERLTPDHCDKMVITIPTRTCPVIKPEDVYKAGR